MRTHMLGALLLAIACRAGESQAVAQGDTGRAVTPRTKLEAFQARSGTVIIMGFESSGKIACQYGGELNVESREITEAASGRKEYGIAVEVTASRGDAERSYIDFDEIESLLKGLDYVAKADKSITPLSDFQADYLTRGSLKVSAFTDKSKVMLAVQAGYPLGRTCYLNMDQAPSLRAAIVKARDRITAIKR
jgi:hypothetical protein